MPSIYDPIPNSPFYSLPSNQISTPQGFLVAGNGISVDPYGTLLVASALGGTVNAITAGTGLGAPATGSIITVSGTLNLLPATASTLGGVKVGANLSIAPDGTISALPPGTGTVSNIIVGTGLTGGGAGPAVNINLGAATTSQIGGVVIGSGLNIAGATVSLASASTASAGGVQLATSAETITGTNTTKAVTPAGLAAKVASTTASGLVQLSTSVASVSTTLAATPSAVKTAYDAAIAAQATAATMLPLAGGTMTGVITFAAGQTFPGVAFPVATTTSLGVVQVGSGLAVTAGGTISTTNNGTVTSVVAGPGLGAPATGNPITSTGTIRLLPPSGTDLGGVKQGSNILIGVDGTISADGLLLTNNPYAFNGYIWPIASTTPGLPCPGATGQVLTVADNVTGTLAWANTGTLTTVAAGTGISVASTATTATVSLATVPSVVPGTYGGTALIPTFTVNSYGQLTSSGLANPFVPFQIATVVAPPALTLDFTTNNTNWEWTLQSNTTIMNPLNAVSGQTGFLKITQDPFTPYVITWDSAWKFANFTPYTGNPTLSSVALISFVVVAANYIVVTAVLDDVG